MVDKTSGTKWLMTSRNIALSGLELLIEMKWNVWGLMRSMLPGRCFFKNRKSGCISKPSHWANFLKFSAQARKLADLERSAEFLNHGVGHFADLPDRGGVDHRLGGGFQNLEPVEHIQNTAAGDEHAVVFQNRRR